VAGGFAAERPVWAGDIERCLYDAPAAGALRAASAGSVTVTADGGG